MKGLIFIYLVSYGGSFFALFNPFIGLCGYYAFAILRPQTLWEWALVATNYDEPFSRYLALATMAGFVIVFFKENIPAFSTGGRTTRQNYSLMGSGLILAALIGMAVVVKLSTMSIVGTGYIDTEYSSALTKITIMTVIGYYLLNSQSRIRIFLWVLFFSQFYLTFEINVLYFVQGHNLILWNDGFGSLNNNGFAMSLLPCIGLAIIVSLYEKPSIFKWTAIACALSSIHVVLLAESRGAYLGLLVIAGMAFYLMKWNSRTVLLFFVLLIVAGFLVGESVQREFATIFVSEGERDHSAESRYELWSMALRVMVENPGLGLGPGRFNDYYYLFQGGGAEDKWKSPHNLYLRLGAECGVFALAFCILFYGMILSKCVLFMRYGRGEDPFLLGVVGGACGGLLGFLVHSIFSDGLTIESSYAVILPALAVFRLKYAENRQSPALEKPSRMVRYAPG